MTDRSAAPPLAGRRKIVRMPYRFAGARCPVPSAAPRRCEHNEAVLTELLGYTAARIDSLREAGVLHQSAPDAR